MRTDSKDTRERETRWLDSARRLVVAEFAGEPVDVYLFGSRARGTARATSDIDVALDGRTPLSKGRLSRLREALEESRVPLRVDLIDLADVDEAFRARVRAEGVRWSA